MTVHTQSSDVTYSAFLPSCTSGFWIVIFAYWPSYYSHSMPVDHQTQNAGHKCRLNGKMNRTSALLEVEGSGNVSFHNCSSSISIREKRCLRACGIQDLEMRQRFRSASSLPHRESTVWSSSSAGRFRTGIVVIVHVQRQNSTPASLFLPLGTNPSFPGQNIEGTLPGNAQCTEDVPTWNIAGKF